MTTFKTMILLLAVSCLSSVCIADEDKPVFIQETAEPVDGQKLPAFSIKSEDVDHVGTVLAAESFDQVLEAVQQTFRPGSAISPQDIAKLLHYRKREASILQSSEYWLYDRDGQRITLEVSGDLFVERLYATLGKNRIGNGGLQRLENHEAINTAQQALGVLRNHLLHKRIDPSRLEIVVERFGKKTRVIKARVKGLSPPGGLVYLMDQKGEIREISVEYAMDAFSGEYPHPQTDAARKRFASDFVAFYGTLSLWVSAKHIISNTSDIEGYAGSPLDKDVEKVIAPMWSFANKGQHVLIVCTYQQYGGVVERFRFAFDEYGWCHVESAVLGSSIGNTLTLE